MAPRNRVYVAAPWTQRKTKVPQAIAALTAAGFNVVSTWHLQPENLPSKTAASDDLRELHSADIIVVLPGKSSTGGLHFETGYAYAQCLRVVVIGSRRCLFHHLRDVESYPGLEDFLKKETKRDTERA